MASAWDERTELLHGTTSTQKALMKYREDLASQETPGLLDKIASPEGAAVGLMALLAGLSGDGRAAAEIGISGLTGAATNVKEQKDAQLAAVDTATMNVFDQISRDQNRAVQVMGLNPETFFAGAPDNAVANEAMGLHEQFSMKTAYEENRARDERLAQAQTYLQLALPLAADSEEQTKTVYDTFFKMSGMYVDPGHVAALAKKEATIDMVLDIARTATPMSQTKINGLLAEAGRQGVSLNDQEFLSKLLDEIVPASAPISVSAAQVAGAKDMEAQSYVAEAEALALYYETDRAIIMDPKSGLWDKAIKSTAFFDTNPDYEIDTTMFEAVRGLIDVGQTIEDANRFGQEFANNPDIALAYEMLGRPMPTAEKIAEGWVNSTVNSAMSQLRSNAGYSAVSAVNRLVGQMAEDLGITIEEMQKDPSIAQWLELQAGTQIVQFERDWMDLRKFRPEAAAVEAHKAAADAALAAFEKSPGEKTEAALEQASLMLESILDAREKASFSKVDYINYRSGGFAESAAATRAARGHPDPPQIVGDIVIGAENTDSFMGPAKPEVKFESSIPGLKAAVSGGTDAAVEEKSKKIAANIKFQKVRELRASGDARRGAVTPAKVEDMSFEDAKEYITQWQTEVLAVKGSRQGVKGVNLYHGMSAENLRSSAEKQFEQAHAKALLVVKAAVAEGSPPPNDSVFMTMIAKFIGLPARDQNPSDRAININYDVWTGPGEADIGAAYMRGDINLGEAFGHGSLLGLKNFYTFNWGEPAENAD